MEKGPKLSSNETQENPWNLADYPNAESWQEEINKIDTMHEWGQITGDQVNELKRDILARAAEQRQRANSKDASAEGASSPSEQGLVGQKFEVAPGISLEAEFERITGEKWPGVKYEAVTIGVDGGEDYPISVYSVRLRESATSTPEKSDSKSEASPYGDKVGEFTTWGDKSDEIIKKQAIDEVVRKYGGSPDDYVVVTAGADGNEDSAGNSWHIYKRANSAPVDGKDNPESDPGDPKDPEVDPIGPEDPEDPDAEKKKGVDLGEILIDNIESKFDKDKEKRLAELEQLLNEQIPELAELYARNRRIIIGSKNKERFKKVSESYREKLDEYLRLRAEFKAKNLAEGLSGWTQERLNELAQEVKDKLVEFAGGDLESTDKTQEEFDAEKQRLIDEAEKTLRDEYNKQLESFNGEINASVLNEVIAWGDKLKGATIDKLNNGTVCRAFVNKVINSKVLKGILTASAAAGIIAAAAALSAGTLGFGGYTLGGAAIGAARGGLSGLLMSRQNAKNSAVNKYIDKGRDENEILSILEDAKTNIPEGDFDTANVAEWLIKRYTGAKDADLRSNRKRSAVATGLGAAFGAALSGLTLNKTVETRTTKMETSNQVVGYEPVEFEAAYLDKVNIPKGGGAWDAYTQLGGDPSNAKNFQRFLDIWREIGKGFGLEAGSNGVSPGFSGKIGEHAYTHPGSLFEWLDKVSQKVALLAFKKAAEEGLIPSIKTGGNAIFGPVEEAMTSVAKAIVPDEFRSRLARTVGAFLSGATVGIGSVLRGSRRSSSPNRPEEPQEADGSSTETSEQEDEPKKLSEQKIKNLAEAIEISEDSLRVILSEGPLTPDLSEKFEKIWDSLDPSTRGALGKAEEEFSKYAATFYEWLNQGDAQE